MILGQDGGGRSSKGYSGVSYGGKYTGYGFYLALETAKFDDFIQKATKLAGNRAAEFISGVMVMLLTAMTNIHPVDTGRSRAGWLPYLVHKGRAAAPSKPAELEGYAASSYEEQLEGNEPYVECVNNVRYDVFLEFGHSMQAPAGFIRINMATIRKSEPEKLVHIVMESYTNAVGGKH